VDLRGFCTSTRLLIVAGKGGVGKTTVTAALARMASRVGLEALIVEVDGRPGLSSAFGTTHRLTYAEVELVAADAGDGTGSVRARTITADDALLDYLNLHGMRRISKRLLRTGAIDVVATAAPGIKDILVLGKVKQLERAAVGSPPLGGGRTGADRSDSGAGARPIDLIVVDAPAAGHAVTFLQSAHGLLDAVHVGPIRSQAQDVVNLLTDPRRCQVILVTLPEETPVNELVETAYSLEDRVGVQLGPVIVNGLYPVLGGLGADPAEVAQAAGVTVTGAEATALRQAADFRQRRQDLQAEQVARLAEALPLAQLRLPYLFTETIGFTEIELLAGALAEDIRQLPPPLAV
jgi:anion-transporting  ArsA/GET3 family ATPase